jgi:hypothetical protein
MSDAEALTGSTGDGCIGPEAIIPFTVSGLNRLSLPLQQHPHHKLCMAITVELEQPKAAGQPDAAAGAALGLGRGAENKEFRVNVRTGPGTAPVVLTLPPCVAATGQPFVMHTFVDSPTSRWICGIGTAVLCKLPTLPRPPKAVVVETGEELNPGNLFTQAVARWSSCQRAQAHQRRRGRDVFVCRPKALLSLADRDQASSKV